jgi:two-component system chemotaxis response regulator CheB
MGADGAKGMLEMKQAAAFTIAQDESTSVVFGMPREAILLNAVDQVLPLGHMPDVLLQRLAGL